MRFSRKSRPDGFYVALLPIVYTPCRFYFDFLRAPVDDGGDIRYAGLTPDSTSRRFSSSLAWSSCGASSRVGIQQREIMSRRSPIAVLIATSVTLAAYLFPYFHLPTSWWRGIPSTFVILLTGALFFGGAMPRVYGLVMTLKRSRSASGSLRFCSVCFRTFS